MPAQIGQDIAVLRRFYPVADPIADPARDPIRDLKTKSGEGDSGDTTGATNLSNLGISLASGSKTNTARYFVDLGATDGLILSNTKLLEDRGWAGLCIEATPVANLLRKNRQCTCVQACVYSDNTEVDFILDTREPLHLMAGIKDCLHNGQPSGITVQYQAVTLEKVLDQVGAPQQIDYLSIDVEGAEWEILRVFPFHKYRFGVISLHHNQAPWRAQMGVWLQANDYRLVGPNLWEDWWVHNEVFPSNVSPASATTALKTRLETPVKSITTEVGTKVENLTLSESTEVKLTSKSSTAVTSPILRAPLASHVALSALCEVYAVPMGGLGNQIFCAMAAVQYARQRGATAYYSLTKDFINPADLNNPKKVYYFDTLIHLPQGQGGFVIPVKEPAEFEPAPAPDVPAGITRVLLQGFFQHPNHLPPRQVVQEYVYWTDQDLAIITAKYAELLAIPNKVSVHVRRGDYLHYLPRESAAMSQYLDQAISLVLEKVPGCTLVFFSDDIEWVKEYWAGFVLRDETTAVSDQVQPNVIFIQPDRDYYELYLISQCHHHINSNSTFSWWGAYLSPHQAGIVTVPYPWFMDRDNIEGLYLEGWVKVPWLKG